MTRLKLDYNEKIESKMTEDVIENIQILKQVFEKSARYKDEKGHEHKIDLANVGINIIVDAPHKQGEQYSLRFQFKDNAGKTKDGQFFLPKEYESQIEQIESAIQTRTLNFNGS